MQQQITELHDLVRTLGSNRMVPRTADALECMSIATTEPPVSRQ